MIPACALMCSFNRITLKGLTLRKFVSDVCVCMIYVCKVTGFVDLLDRGFICEKSLEMCICL